MEPSSPCASCPCTESDSSEEMLLALRPADVHKGGGESISHCLHPSHRDSLKQTLSLLDPLLMRSLRTWGPLSGVL